MVLDYMARVLFFALFSAKAFAYLITPLDTFPASGVADGLMPAFTPAHTMPRR